MSVTEELIYQYPCPFLGSFTDPKSVMSYPSQSNRCYALGEALEATREKQGTHCLFENYSSCHIYQQVLAKQLGPDDISNDVGFLDRIFRARSLALAVMLLLILLAALIWWPFPGFNVEDGTVFGYPIVQNAQEIQAPEEETVVDDAAQPARTEQSDSDSVAVQAPEAEVDQISADTGREQIAAKPTAVPPPSISDLPDLYQLFQIQQEETADDANDSFSPLTYSDKGVDVPSLSADANEETLRIYLVLPDEDKGLALNISRMEQVNILGRDVSGTWVRARTDSGIEGWIRVKDTALGDWVSTLSEFEESGESEELLSVPTTLPAIAETEVERSKLAVYIAPTSKSKIITQINKGEVVSLLGRWKGGAWVRIRHDDGTEGWVRSGGLALADN